MPTTLTGELWLQNMLGCFLTIFYVKMYNIVVNCACNSNSISELLTSCRY